MTQQRRESSVDRLAERRGCIGPYPCGIGAGANGSDLPCDCAWLAEHLNAEALDHPLPWRIHHDWTYEVTASDGCIVAKCMEEDEADRIIELVARIEQAGDHA